MLRPRIHATLFQRSSLCPSRIALCKLTAVSLLPTLQVRAFSPGLVGDDPMYYKVE
eukprot:gene7592-biopygen14254